MSNLSKIEAWIQQQDDELLYDVDGEQAHREYCEQLRVMTPVRFDCSTSASSPFSINNGAVFYFAELMIDRHTPFIGIVDDRDSSE